MMHLFAGSQRVVSIRSDGHEQYYHPDHLGSASIVSDETGTIQEKIEYFPFGSYRERSDYNPSFPDVNYTFTDQEEDDEVGLYNYKARLYDPVLGRFLSADSVIPNPGDLQSYNRYSYCNNNPLIYTDPSGHFSLGGLFESITESVLKATSEVSNVAGYVGDALLAAPQDAYFRSIGYGDVVDSARAGAVLGAEDGGWVGAIVGGVIGAGSAYFTNHTSAGRQTVGWVNVHVMRQGLGFGNPYVSYAGATMLVKTAASFAGQAAVWAGAYVYAHVGSEVGSGQYSMPPNGFQTPGSPFGDWIPSLEELQTKFGSETSGPQTAWFDDAGYAQKVSDAPQSFPGITHGQTAIAAGAMAALPAAAIAAPYIPGAAAALGVAYLSNPTPANNFMMDAINGYLPTTAPNPTLGGFFGAVTSKFQQLLSR